MSSPDLNVPAPFWLLGGHMQTIWPALFSRAFSEHKPQYTRQRWDAPDGDFVDVDFSTHAVESSTPFLVLFHGLEGSSQSHYALAFADWARVRKIPLAVPHFRGCSGEVNRMPRAYHSGDFEEIDWLLRRIQASHPNRQLIVVGVSLGGNALMRWAQEMGKEAAKVVSAVASVSSPLDLMSSGHWIGLGLNRHIYTPLFLRTMKPKALERLALHPGLFDGKKLQASQNLYEFDNVFTAPLHGFKNTEDYWRRASAKPRMADIQIPALALNALNDPFMPVSSLPKKSEVGQHVTLWQPAHGGHVGFAQGGFQTHVHAMPHAVGQWLLNKC